MAKIMSPSASLGRDWLCCKEQWHPEMNSNAIQKASLNAIEMTSYSIALLTIVCFYDMLSPQLFLVEFYAVWCFLLLFHIFHTDCVGILALFFFFTLPSAAHTRTLVLIFYQSYSTFHFHHGNCESRVMTGQVVFRHLQWHWPCHNNMRDPERKVERTKLSSSMSMCICSSVWRFRNLWKVLYLEHQIVSQPQAWVLRFSI